MNIHAIVSTFNGSEWIEKCLNSLQNSSVPIHIDVIDNVSTDNTVEIIRLKFPNVNLIVNEQNMGFGQANNVMMRLALADQADYVFLLNQDAWVDPGTIEGLISAQKQNPGYGILSPIHLAGSGKAMDLNFSRYCNMERCPGFLSDLYLQQTKPVYPIKFVNGALWLISRECLESVGLFDPLFPVYVEDLDFVSRLKFKGYKVGIVPEFKGYHDRENRAFSNPEKDRRLAFLKYKYAIKDPNHSFIKGLGRFYAVHFRRLFKNLIHFNGSGFLQELKSGIKITFSIQEIIRARNICRASGAYIDNKIITHRI